MSAPHHAHFAEETALPEHRREISDDLFKAFDLDGNGAVSFSELNQVLEACKQRRKEGNEGAPVDAALERQRAKWMMAVKSQIHQAREQVKRRQSAASFSLKSSNSTVGNIHFLGNVANGDGDPSLDPDAFAEFIRIYGGKYSEDDFALFTSELRAAVQDAYENTFGSRKKKLIWELFRLMDVNHDGVIDMKELQLLLHVESKKDKKSIAKWTAIIKQRQTDRKRDATNTAPSGGSSPNAQRKESFGSNSAKGDDRRASHFAHEDGILTIKEEEVIGQDSDDDEKDGKDSASKDGDAPPMGLKDFQDFLSDFYGDDSDRIEATCTQVRDVLVNANRRYLSEMKVDEIMNDIVEDLLRERPHDVLEGITRSVNRLKRLGNFPSKIYRSWSIASHPFAGATANSSANLLADEKKSA